MQSHFRENRPVFSLNCTEALMMLVRFVGDLHQPTHIGGVHVDANGHVVDPVSSADERAPVSGRPASTAPLAAFHRHPNSEELHGHWEETYVAYSSDLRRFP